ncbi:MAG: 4Fe-4S binding protein [Coriobacteriales bacterium]
MNSRKMKISTMRGIVVAAVVALVAAGLVFHTGTGTPSAFGIGSIAALCPAGALEAMMGAKGILLHPLMLLGITVVLVLVFGKAFCAWVCPTTYLQSFFSFGKKKPAPAGDEDAASEAGEGEVPEGIDQEALGAGIAKLSTAGHGSSCGSCASGCALSAIGGKRDGYKPDSRLLVLGGALASSFAFGFPVFCIVCPVGLTFGTMIALWHLLQFNETSWGLLIFPAILILELVFFRKWCKHFCPISALISLISNGNKLFRPAVDSDKCLRAQGIECSACVDVCPEEVDPHSGNIPECSKCGKCADACPRAAISFPVLRTKAAPAAKLEQPQEN